MATLNVRNESNKFIKLDGDSFILKPASEIEDITFELLDVSSDKTFNIYSDEACDNFVGIFKLIFRTNDGVFLNLGNLSGNKLLGDFDFQNNIEVSIENEEKLLDWLVLNSSTIINLTLANV